MSKSLLILLAILVLIFLAGCAEEPQIIGADDSTTDFSVVKTSKTITKSRLEGKLGVTEFSTRSVVFKKQQDKIKYDLDYSKIKSDQEGFRWIDITSKNPIIHRQGLYYIIDGYEHYFTWFYKEYDCKEVFYSEINGTIRHCEYEDKVAIRQVDNYTLAIGWKAENQSDLVYDPLISDWIGNVTAYWKFDDNSSHVFQDYAGNVNNHSASRDWGANGYYTSDTPSGEGQAYKFLANGRWKAANAGDLTSLTSGEITMALKGDNNAELRPYYTENGRLALVIRTHRQQININTNGTDCNLYYFEHSSYLDNETWEFVTFGFNGTHCYIYNNQTLIRSEAATGTMESGTWTAIGRGNGQPYYGKMDCLSATSNGWLDADAREEAYDDCFGVEEGTNDGITIDVFTNESLSPTTAILNDTLSEAGRSTARVYSDDNCDAGDMVCVSHNLTDATKHKHYISNLTASTDYYAILNVTNGIKTNTTLCQGMNFTTTAAATGAVIIYVNVLDSSWKTMEVIR